MAVSCDLRVAADDVRIRIPELALGIPLTWGGIPRLAREIGLPLARALVVEKEQAGGAGGCLPLHLVYKLGLALLTAHGPMDVAGV